MLTPAQFAERVNIPVRTIQNLMKNGKLRGQRIGGQWRVFPPEMQDVKP